MLLINNKSLQKQIPKKKYAFHLNRNDQQKSIRKTKNKFTTETE